MLPWVVFTVTGSHEMELPSAVIQLGVPWQAPGLLIVSMVLEILAVAAWAPTVEQRRRPWTHGSENASHSLLILLGCELDG